MPVDDARLVEVVRRHFNVHLVADRDADEILAHFAGDVREHAWPFGGSTGTWFRAALLDMAGQFNRLFFGHGAAIVVPK